MRLFAKHCERCSTIRDAIHLGTRGCLFDFDVNLTEARLKVLGGFVCTQCRTALQADGLDELVNELNSILEKSWLGKSTEPDKPAGIIAKLGADMFVTTGLKPTAWEAFKTTIQQEWAKQLLIVIATVLGAVILVLLGLKK